MDQTTDKVPIDQLAQLEYDKSVLFFGVVPLVVIAVAAVVCIVLYFVRRSRNWNDLGEAMRLGDGDQPIGEGQDGFATRDLAELEPTKPSQRLAEVGKDE